MLQENTFKGATDSNPLKEMAAHLNHLENELFQAEQAALSAKGTFAWNNRVIKNSSGFTPTHVIQQFVAENFKNPKTWAKDFLKELKLEDQLSEKDAGKLISGELIPGSKLTDYLGEMFVSTLGIIKHTFVNDCIHLREDRGKASIDIEAIPQWLRQIYPFVRTTPEKSTESKYYKLLVPSIRAFAKRHQEKNKAVDVGKMSDVDLLDAFCGAFRANSHYNINRLMLQGFVPLPLLSKTRIVNEIASALASGDRTLKSQLGELGHQFFNEVEGIDLLTARESGGLTYGMALSTLRINKSLIIRDLKKASGIDSSSILAQEIYGSESTLRVLEQLSNHVLPADEYREPYRELLIGLSRKKHGVLIKKNSELKFNQLIEKLYLQSQLKQSDITQKIGVHHDALGEWVKGVSIPSLKETGELVQICFQTGRLEGSAEDFFNLAYEKRVVARWEKENLNRPDSELGAHQLLKKIRIQAGFEDRNEVAGQNTLGRWERGQGRPSEKVFNKVLDQYFSTGKIKDYDTNALKSKEVLSELIVEKENDLFQRSLLKKYNIGKPNAGLKINELVRKLYVETGSFSSMRTAIPNLRLDYIVTGYPISEDALDKMTRFFYEKIDRVIQTRSATTLKARLHLFHGISNSKTEKMTPDGLRGLYSEKLLEEINLLEQKWSNGEQRRNTISKESVYFERGNKFEKGISPRRGLEK